MEGARETKRERRTNRETISVTARGIDDRVVGDEFIIILTRTWN